MSGMLRVCVCDINAKCGNMWRFERHLFFKELMTQIRAKSDSKSAAVCIRCGGITTRAQQLFSPKLTICSTCLFILITVVYSLSS